MEKIVLSETLSLSRLIDGMWRLGDDSNTSAAHVQAKIEACLSLGITTMIKQISMGVSGRGNSWLYTSGCTISREQIEIVTKRDIIAPAGRHSAARLKYYDTSAAHIRQSVEIAVPNANRHDRPFADSGLIRSWTTMKQGLFLTS